MNDFEYKISLKKKGVVLAVEVRGQARPQQIVDMYFDIQWQGRKSGCSRVLMDMLHIKLDFEPLQLLDMLNKVEEAIRPFKVAKLIDLGEYRHDLVEAMCQQRQLNVKNFSERDQALYWLVDI